ncbi:hypothetical protein EIN_019160, partial [Entamoeba invadens IP1]|uniref:hypothetical protein n=1 Tax=Entamoeba invadens IP1 TaxID=370355 RepID=UPI0002C3DCD9
GEMVLMMLTNGDGVKLVEEKFGNDKAMFEGELSKVTSRVTEEYHDKKVGFTTYETVINYINDKENSRKIILDAAYMSDKANWSGLFEIVDSPVVMFMDCLEKGEIKDAVKCIPIIKEIHSGAVALQYTLALIKKMIENEKELEKIPELVWMFTRKEIVEGSGVGEGVELLRILRVLINKSVVILLRDCNFEALYKFCEKPNEVLGNVLKMEFRDEIDETDGMKNAENFVKLHPPQHVLFLGKALLENNHYIPTLLLGVASRLKSLLVFPESNSYLEELIDEFQYTNLDMANLIKKYREIVMQSTALNV